jgi:cytochrome c-type biogenesis protein CcmH
MRRIRIQRALLLVLALVALFVVATAIAGYAWDTPQQAGQVERPATTAVEQPAFLGALTPTPDPNEVEAVSRELYCPLCTGLRLDNCDLPLCDQMREVIRQKLAAGETKEEIKAYFVEQYGETVTGVPPKRGGMVLVWVLPFLALLVAGAWVYYTVHRRAGKRQTEEAEISASTPLPSEYVERVERDLEQLR